MKLRAASIFQIFAFAVCTVLIISCEEKEDYDNFGPSVYQDNGVKGISGQYMKRDSVGFIVVADTSYLRDSLVITLDPDSIVSIDTVAMDTTFFIDTVIIPIDTITFSNRTVFDENVRQLSYSNQNITLKPYAIASGIRIGITGQSPDGEGISITIPYPTPVGTTIPIDTVSAAQVRYFTKNRAYLTDSGSMTITVADTVNGRVSGNFNIRTARNARIRVTDGTFDINYDREALLP